MAARDPQTGQFVSSDQPTRFRDYDVQHVRATFRDNGIGDNAALTMQDVVEMDPPADRQEDAELVALLVHNMRAEVDPATVTASGGVRAGWEITRNDDIGPLTQFRSEVNLDNNAFEGGGGGTVTPSDPLSRQSVTLDNDVHFFGLVRGDRGSGYSDNGFLGPVAINYREITGRGPVYTGGDSVHFHGRVNKVELGANWVTDISASLFWNVYDRD